ncbi:MAG TPA: sigma-70 family RNA polymerase sigma factor [Chitinophagaceae bacterium]
MKAVRYDHITDAELLENYYASHDQQWIGVLLERYTLLLFGVCMKYMKDEHEAQDCVQQIFLKVLTEVGRYRIDYFKSWLYMVAKNHCLMRLRSTNGRVLREITDDALTDTDSDKTELLENERTYDLLEEAMEELSIEQRQCVTLFYLQKKSYSEISEQTGYSPMQVKSYIQNGKRNLKLTLERKIKEQDATKK